MSPSPAAPVESTALLTSSSPRLPPPPGILPRPGPPTPSTSTSYLVPPRPHSSLTRFILHRSHSPLPSLSSVALNESDLSVDPLGLDLLQEPHPVILSQLRSTHFAHRFRISRFSLLDTFKAILLSLLTIHTANRFIGPLPTLHPLPLRADPYYWSYPLLLPFDHPSQYSIHLLTLACLPGLHFILGSSTVLAIHTRRSLGWRSHSIFFRSLKLGFTLLILNQLLISPNIFRSRGKVVLNTLPIWSLGWNLIFMTTILIGLFLSERTALNYLHGKTNDCRLEPTHLPDCEEEVNQELEWLRTWADRIRKSIDAILVLGAALIPFSIGYMLPGNRLDPDPDWWIEWSQTRPWWFWLFFVPTPEMSAHPRFKMVTNFAPIGWLPFVLLGAYYGRRLLHKPQERLGMFIRHLKLSMISGLVFILMTRVLDLGNLAVPYERVPDSDLIKPIDPGLFRWLRGSWEMVLYTTTFPPDLGYLSLASTLIFLLLALLDLIPTTLLSLSPLLEFGRSPIFFYSIQLLSFHYVLPSILVILDWPRHLNLLWISIVSISSLPVLWLACEAWVIFKDRQPPESLWRFF